MKLGLGQSRSLLPFCFALILAGSYSAFGEELSGRPRILDGDTLAFGDAKVRLNGIDAPERNQLCQDRAGKSYNCGQSATAALNGQIRSAQVRCIGDKYDRYQRLIATCSVGTEDLNAWMAEHGWAVAYRKYSGVYVPQEGKAQKARAGMWSGTFDMPWDWRRQH